MHDMLLRMLIGVCCLPLVASSADAGDPVRVRVLSYNIHHAEGTDGKLELPRIGKIISSVQPDLVALQEIDFKTMRTGGVDQAEELGRLTGLHVASGPNIDYQNGQYGTAIPSRWKIVSHKNHPLPNAGGEQRGVLAAEIETGNDGPRLSFLGTHLDHRPAEAERLASAKFINELAETLDGPALLAGDLNAIPTSETLKLLQQNWTNPTASHPLPTIPSKVPTRQIDYVLFRPADDWRMIEARVLDEPVASDHRPLLVVLEWRPVK
jgi:endonuclease/exonuclease/phosphatase family metal-dependent hydrolase